MRMYRTVRWTLIRDYRNHERDELYDLKHAPAESTNLFESKEPIHRRIRRLLNQRIESRMLTFQDPVFKSLVED